MNDAKQPDHQRPPWLPRDGWIAPWPAGHDWDAIVIHGRLGHDLMCHWADHQPGPVMYDPHAPLGAVTCLVPPGTATEWDEPDTEALGETQHLYLPGRLASDDISVLHWVKPPGTGPQHVDPDELRRALAAVRAAAP